MGSHVDLAPTLLDMLGIYERNSFLGVSLIRSDIEIRRVFMIHDTRWNMRISSAGLYDSGPEIFLDHFPFLLPRHQHELKHENIRHIAFETNADLLKTRSPLNITTLSSEKAKRMEQMAETAIKDAFILAFHNRISPPPRPLNSGVPDMAQPALIAHAGGSARSLPYTNSLEALNENYKKGCRFFEVDFELTDDGKFVLIHDWDTTWKEYFHEEGVPTLDEYSRATMVKGLTQMTLERLMDWMATHRDAHIVTDFKFKNFEGLNAIRNHAPELTDRIIPQIIHFREYGRVKSLGYNNIILTLYISNPTDIEVMDFVSRNEVFAVTMHKERALQTDLALNLGTQGIFVYAHPVNSQTDMILLKKRGIKGFYTTSF